MHACQIEVEAASQHQAHVDEATPWFVQTKKKYFLIEQASVPMQMPYVYPKVCEEVTLSEIIPPLALVA